MRVIIVDDEDLARGLVREFLARHADIEIVAECANGFDAVKAITDLAPDLVFLDIQMPKLNGFDVVELAGSKARYIFVTAYDQYALKAFDIHAVDYLLKPFSQQRLDAALAHARTSVTQGGVDAVLRESALRGKPLERVLIRDGARVHIIAAGQIDYIEAQDDYVRISAGGKHHLKNQRLAELESQLDPAVFVRVHRSWMLNLGAIDRIEQGRDSHCAILKDATRIPVSRSGYQKLMALLG
ncbi:response regulator transcription factor [Massilia violaceinigra]|uniref:Response regulator transcription factor n=1 Tax=Massilia violaceinigra TaxID=2045208 RepID=A0ABY4A299_9BURK|nr:LytTR family DNA-binding domain-containing protein [Massilia violaceinigra]UOD28507.1 response regulator transcription factor [Massilia violaceinigra]